MGLAFLTGLNRVYKYQYLFNKTRRLGLLRGSIIGYLVLQTLWFFLGLMMPYGFMDLFQVPRYELSHSYE